MKLKREFILNWIESKNWTFVKFCSRAGVSLCDFRKMMGYVKCDNVEDLIVLNINKLAKVVGVNICDLFEN